VQVFVPATKSAAESSKPTDEESPIMQLVGVVNMLLFGWPLYLTMNIAGPAKYAGKANSHFNPRSALFELHDWLDIVKVAWRRCCCIAHSAMCDARVCCVLRRSRTSASLLRWPWSASPRTPTASQR
jgi:hypothetical protein